MDNYGDIVFVHELEAVLSGRSTYKPRRRERNALRRILLSMYACGVRSQPQYSHEATAHRAAWRCGVFGYGIAWRR